jgi:regulator of protease activity HflC (stomatin/prohibitin superfamily)
LQLSLILYFYELIVANSKLPKFQLNGFYVALIAVFLVIAGLASMSFVTIQYGSVGLITRFGAVTGRKVEPGLHFKIPLVDGVVTYRTQKITYETSNNPQISDANYTDVPVDTTTEDGQPIKIRYTIRFSVDGSRVDWIANNIGNESDIVEKIVKTESRVIVRNVPRSFIAQDLYTGNIDQAQTEIFDSLNPIFEENGLVLDSFGIRQIEFQQEYIDAIERKQIEKENIATEEARAEQEEFRKQQAITKAEGEAEAQRLQQQTLTDPLLRKLWIEKWNGELPQYMAGEESDVILGL